MNVLLIREGENGVIEGIRFDGNMLARMLNITDGEWKPLPSTAITTGAQGLQDYIEKGPRG